MHFLNVFKVHDKVDVHNASCQKVEFNGLKLLYINKEMFVIPRSLKLMNNEYTS